MNNLLFRFIMSTVAFFLSLFILNISGKNPLPLPFSKNPRKEKIEVGTFTLIALFYFSLDIFIISPLVYSFYIQLGISTILLLFIPLIYTRYRDNWTIKDYGITSKIRNWWVVFFSILIFLYIGYLNTFIEDISWYLLIIFIYSNIFLEEFLFRGVIQSKLERAIGQNKSVFYQGILFMLIHTPKYIFDLSVDGNYLLFIMKFGVQLFNGIIFGLIYMKTRNIWISVICHYLNNWFGSIIIQVL